MAPNALTDGSSGTEVDFNEISARIVNGAFLIHAEIGPGLPESVYKVLLADILREEGFLVQREVPIPIRVRGKIFDEGFRADMIVERCIIVEAKSIEQLARAHAKQLMTHLRLSGLKLGLLINFGGERLKGNIERIVNGSVPDLKDSHEHRR